MITTPPLSLSCARPPPGTCEGRVCVCVCEGVCVCLSACCLALPRVEEAGGSEGGGLPGSTIP
eukprot:1218464-Rhodomonas_salina.1